MKAARQSLSFRGDDGTGWSLAWKINFWARFLDGDHAYELIKLLFRIKEEANVNWSGGSYVNLFDSHPPFQIDGNFGAPALPAALPDGYIRGICARGGFELDMEWSGGKVNSLSVKSKAGATCKIRYEGKISEFPTAKGKIYTMGKDFILNNR
ncbi:MAG: glycoside hydrolase family 95-like protein [Bacteroidales bacterium]